MDGEMPDFINSLDAFDRLVLMMHWGDCCSVPEMERITGTEADRIVDSMRRIRSLAAGSLALSSTTPRAASPGRRHPLLRRR